MSEGGGSACRAASLACHWTIDEAGLIRQSLSAQVLQHLDSEGLSRAAAVLRSLPQETVLVVGQAHSYVTSIFDAADAVIKRNGCSHMEAT